jgi:hypothetical protein
MTEAVAASSGAPAQGAPGATDAPVQGGQPAAQPNADALNIGDPAAPAAKSEAAPSSEVIAYEKTGDPGLDMALAFVGERGFGDDHPAMQAAIKGDFTLLEAALGALGDKAKGYENFLALAKQSFESSKSKADAAAQANAKLVHDAVGGEEQWNAIKEWASANAEPAEKEAVNLALKQGGLLAKITAQWLANTYSRAAGTVVKPKTAVDSGAAGKPDSAGPLSAKDFATQSQTLRNKLGPDFEKTQEFKILAQRRSVGRAKGI